MHVKHALYRGGLCIFDAFSCTLTEKNPLTEMGFMKGSSPALTDMDAAQASQFVGQSSRDRRDL